MPDATNDKSHASRGGAAPNTYAIVETGGKQYRAEKGAKLLVERLPDEEGAKVTLRPVMFRSDGSVAVAGGDLEKVKVEAVVAEHLRGPKLRIFKHRPKKGYRRRAGHRQELTRLEVTEVKMLSRKPAAKKTTTGSSQGTAAKETKPKAETKAEASTRSKTSSARKSGSTSRKSSTTTTRTKKETS
jgi:large subunit ribosomal protein L21